MVNTQMITLTVTGVQDQEYVKRQGGSDAFLMALGDEERDVILKAEPDNQFDPRAVRVEMEEAGFNSVGYIAAEEADIVHAMLDGRQYLKAKVCGNDRHRTFFVAVNDEDGLGRLAQEKMFLWEMPDVVDIGLGQKIHIPEEEKQLEKIEQMLIEIKVDDNSLGRFINLLQTYFHFGMIAINREDAVCRRMIYLKILNVMRDIKSEEIVCEQEKRDSIELMRDKFRTIVNDFLIQDVLYKAYVVQLENVQKAAETEDGFWDKYCKKCFYGDIRKVPEIDIKEEVRHVENWLKNSLPDNIHLLYYNNDVEFAHALSHANLSRERLYKVYANINALSCLIHELKRREINRWFVLPMEFASDFYMTYWRRLVKAGYLKDDYRIDKKEIKALKASYIAHCFSKKKNANHEYWQTFQEFWNIKGLAQSYEKMERSKSKQNEAFKREIQKIFST